MKITSIELLRFSRSITVHAGPVDWLWVVLHTDQGVTGLGETYPCADVESAVIERSLAPVLLGSDPRRIERLWADMFLAVSYHGWAGAEMRAISAIDIALHDLAAKSAGIPVYQLLGGASQTSIPVYNTCYDHIDFLTEPVRLARELADSGIHAMKIWPFDPVAKRTGGQSISAEEIRQGLEPLRLIRQEFGDSMQVAMEFHGYWNLHCARLIVRGLEPLDPMWVEEILPQDNLSAYRELAAYTRLPLTISERLMTRFAFRELLELRAASVIMPDLCWCGGFTEARKIAALADTYYLPVAPHNCGGPVLHFASAHLAASLTNLLILETVRRHYADEYRGLLTASLVPQKGRLSLPAGRGLGVELDPSVRSHPRVAVKKIERSS